MFRYTLIMLASLFLAGCVASTKETPTTTTVNDNKKLRDPVFINGQPVMSREDWVHNFKIMATPVLCNDPKAGFKAAYKGLPAKCPATVNTLINKCINGPLEKIIPLKIQGQIIAVKSGQALGSCILVTYQSQY